MTVAWFGICWFHVCELISALALFGVAYIFLFFAAVGALLVWDATEQITIWAKPLSRKVVAFPFALSRHAWNLALRGKLSTG